jgi:hypothetical protein
VAAERRRSSPETALVLLVAAVLIALCVFALVKARDGFELECTTGTIDLSDLALSGSPDVWDARIDACFPDGVDGVPGSVNSSLLWDQLLIAVYVPTLALLCAYGGLRSRRKPTRRLGWFMLYLAVFAGVMDMAEDHLLWLAFYRPQPPPDTLLRLLFATSLAKWVVVLPMLYGLLALMTALSRVVRRDRTPPGGPVPPGLLPGPPAFLDPRRAEVPTPRAVAHRYVRPDSTPGDALAISFSGGGIRAAAFAMGALQSLEQTGLYARATYLATVSGGGYLGTAAHLVGTKSQPSVAAPFAPEAGDDPAGPIQSPEAEHVRANARYLWPTPKRDKHGAGFVSTASTAVFSILFNLVLVTVCIYVVATPVGWGARALLGTRGPRPDGWLLATILVTVALAPLVTLAWARAIGGSITGFGRWVAAAIAGVVTTVATVQLLWYDVPGWWYWWAAAALLAVGLVGALVQAVSGRRHRGRARTGTPWMALVPAPLLALSAFFLWEWWYGGAFATGWHGSVSSLFAWWIVGLVAGALVGIMTAQLVRRIWGWTHRDANDQEPSPKWFLFGAPGAAVVGAVVATLVIADRGRAVGLAIAAVAAVFWLWGMVTFVVHQGTPGRRPGRSGLLGFAFGGLALVVVVVALAWVIVSGEATAWVVWTAFFLGLLLLYFLVDQKAWSPHGMYKGHLAATFSRVRAGDTTEPIKDTPLDELSEPAGHPQLLVCAAAYDTDHCPGEVQAWPFTFARDFVGGPDVGWCRTKDFQAALGNFNRSDATVQAAMAISGAAVSPGLGHIRFGSLNALIALANLRLGVWLPAPRYVNQLKGVDGWTSAREGEHPRWIRWRRFTYLFKEVFGVHDPTDRFVMVTDGGQVDNLGLLELLSRRCRLIVCIDASGDNRRRRPLGTRTLDGVRKLAYDRYGVRVGLHGGDLDPPLDHDSADLPFTPDPHLLKDLVTVSAPDPNGEIDERTAVAAVAVLDIRYPEVPGGVGPTEGADTDVSSGTLVYAKALLFDGLTDEEEPTFVEFAAGRRGRRFPSDSTGDQWPNHDQFTMYERLGKVVGRLAGEKANGALADMASEADAAEAGDAASAAMEAGATGPATEPAATS